MTLTDRIRQIDLAGVIESAGITLRRHGKHPVGLCPFHSDRIPSLTIYDDHFHCFGCGAHGDAVDFVMKHYGMGFQDALSHLGIENSEPSKISLQEIENQKKKQIEKKKRIQRKRDLIFTLGILIRTTKKVMDRPTPGNFNDHCEILEPLEWWKHCHEMLCTGSKEDKGLVMHDLKDMPTISRNYLFRGDFDYRKWLQTFLNSEEKCRAKTT